MRRLIERPVRENAAKTYCTDDHRSINTLKPCCGSLMANFFGRSSPATVWYSE